MYVPPGPMTTTYLKARITAAIVNINTETYGLTKITLQTSYMQYKKENVY